MPKPKQTAAQSAAVDLESTVAQFYDDPLGFVLFVFAWAQPGTVLQKHNGPDIWQVLVLKKLGELIRASQGNVAEEMAAIRMAIASGHGVGKSSLVAWIIIWFMSTRAAPQIVVTANTQVQLTTKTWRELAKWHRLAINADWFQWTATRFYFKGRQEDWFAAAIPWSEHRPDAFAGTHADHVLVIFDEASQIADAIWEVAEGALTTTGAMWLVFGNPTRNTGRFRECWTKFRRRWHRLQVDSRRAKMANKAQIKQWIEDYGEDSDFVRVRVRGVFPRAGTNQLISGEIIDAARNRTLVEEDYAHAAIVVGVDPARFGDDQSVIVVRQGPKIHEIKRFRELDTMQLAFRAKEAIDEYKPEGIFVDVVGLGAGVADKLRLIGHDVIEVNGAEKADETNKYYNRRAEHWWRLRDWLKTSAVLEFEILDQELEDQLNGPEYGYDNHNRVQLEKKEDLKQRIGMSPDTADAIAITFDTEIIKREVHVSVMDRLRQMIRGQRDAGTSWMSR